MSRSQRLFPILIACLTGVASGVYIFQQPLKEQADARHLQEEMERTMRGSPPTNSTQLDTEPPSTPAQT